MDDFTKFDGVYGVESHEFDNLAYTGTVMLTGDVTGVAESAFMNNIGLLALTLPEGTATIGSNAFNNCSKLTVLTLPASLREIGYGAFAYASQISDVYCTADAANVTWDDNANTYQFMEDNATKFHVTDAAAWKAKFPDANVTFIDGSETAIQQITSPTAINEKCYNLNGLRVEKNYKGVIVINGKKVVVK